MIDLRAIANRVEIEVLRVDLIDALTMHDDDRFESLFIGDGPGRITCAAGRLSSVA